MLIYFVNWDFLANFVSNKVSLTKSHLNSEVEDAICDMEKLGSVSDDACRAVGVSGAEEMKSWYVANVGHNTEIISAERLSKLGDECFAATQPDYRVWRNGRRKKIDRVVIPSVIFIKCTEQRRREIVTLPYIRRFMTNKAATQGEKDYHKPLAIIPERQIQKLRFMLGSSENPVEFVTYKKGDKVKVVRGPLRGLEGEVMNDSDGTSSLIVDLGILGVAKTKIDPTDLLPV